MRNMRKVGLCGFCLLVLLASVVLSAPATGSNPASGSVTVPGAPGGSATDSWTGTILPGANATSSCEHFEPASDQHGIAITVPAGTYDTVDAKFEFSITWDAGSSSDEILTVVDPTGHVVGSSDGGSNIEKVVAHDLFPGTYNVLACTFLSTLPTDYTGQLMVTTTARANEPSLPSAPANGFAFSAAVPVDNQRDQAEPLLQIDKSGHIYDCGPTGFSNFSDYASGLDRRWRPVPPTRDASARPAGDRRRR